MLGFSPMPQPYWSMERKPALGGIVRPVFPSVCIAEEKRRNVFPRHCHRTYELILVDSGTYVGHLNGTELTLHPGRALLVKPGDWHEDACRPPLRYRGINFQVEWPGGASPVLFSTVARPTDQVFPAPARIFGNLFDKIRAESRRADTVSSLVLAALIEELFWRTTRALRPHALSLPFQQLTQERALGLQLERLFQVRQHESLPVGEMARALGTTERTLDRRCRLLFGESPARCFARFKVRQAAVLLRETSRPIKEISAELGFGNPYHFSRLFRRLEGHPPSALRHPGPPTPE